MKQLPPHILDWLTSRTISLDVINQANIDYQDRRIVIPVYSSRGELKFNKYRRDPQDDTGLRYTYDKGSSASLYGAEILTDKILHIIICEGELDSLALRSHGFTAVSSTGGSGVFREKWAEKLLEYSVPIYVCYDNDTPGFVGAVKIASMIPGARIIWLPQNLGLKGDVTDFLVNGGDFSGLMNHSMSFPGAINLKPYYTKQEVKKEKERFTEELYNLMRIAREVRARYESDEHIQIMIDKINESVDKLNFLLKKTSEHRNYVFTFGTDSLSKAKRVPISNFIRFGPRGNAKCVWHDEKTPSMHYYKNTNRVKCFGCGKSGDVIDVVQTLNNLSLVEAIKYLNDLF